MQHLQRAGTQSGGAEGCIAQERQRQSAASHKSVSCTGNRASHRSHAGPEECPNSLKFVRGNVPHFRQRAIDTQGVGDRSDALCSVSSLVIFIEAAQLVA